VINCECHYGQPVVLGVDVSISTYSRLEASLWAPATEIQDKSRNVRSSWKRAWPCCKGATSANPTSRGEILWHIGDK
jgi:hypothetical protein